MKRFKILSIFLILILQSCGSTSANSQTDDTEISADARYDCITTPNLQLGEKATYRFNDKGKISYLSAEVIDEDNQSYTIAFEENKEVQYYQWLKNCQTSETLSAIYTDAKKNYILRGAYSQNTSSQNTNDTSEDASSTDGVMQGFYLTKITQLESFTVEAGTYTLVEKTLLTAQSTDLAIAFYESYLKESIYYDVNIPFVGLLKSIDGYRDDSNITIELIYWNGL
ncbi:MAG: hypothetical protein KU38_12125 [Sulfurovum sp. FS08-3]|nr:MAG: hypothetical protein KU38_12125 [Sulfurovum sp. FS08-3]